jgi:molecular chaperone GrpE
MHNSETNSEFASDLNPDSVLSEAEAAALHSSAPQAEGEQEHSGFKVHDKRFWKRDAQELEEGNRPQLPSYVENLRLQLEEKDKQLRDYIAAYKKEVVEGLEKTKGRLERENQQKLEQLQGRLAMPMLEVLDALERSITAGEAESAAAPFLQGVKLVYQLMVQKLTEMGLSRLETVGQVFDPNIHEAVALTPVTDAALHNRVINELKPGFSLAGRVIRPALVQVGKQS